MTFLYEVHADPRSLRGDGSMDTTALVRVQKGESETRRSTRLAWVHRPSRRSRGWHDRTQR